MGKAILRIDDEFQSLFPPLHPDERARLEQSLLNEGCRDAVVVWKEQNLLADGHNRLKICEEHNIEYKVEVRSFADRDAVKAWLIDNQLGRRNLNRNWSNYLIGVEYRSQKRQGARSDLTSPHFGEKSDEKAKKTTAEKIAENHKVGKSTVERAAKFADAIDQVAEKYGDEYRNKFLDKEIDLPQKDVEKFLALRDWQQEQVLELLETDKAKSLDAAFFLVRKRNYRRNKGEGGSDFNRDDNQPNTFCKPGDIWKLSVHRLGCLDATEEAAYLQLLGGKRASLVFSDPPYNVNYTDHGDKIANDNLSPEQFRHLLNSSIKNMINNCDGSFYICMGSSKIDVLKQAFEEAGGHFGDILIWLKNKPTMGWGGFQRKYEMILYGWKQGSSRYFAPSRSETNVWEVDVNVANEWHLTQKPVELIERAIDLSTHSRSAIVLDPFAGSGSTLIACHRKVRRAFLMELEAHRCDTIIRRFISETQFGLMPMLTWRDGKEDRRSLRQICQSNEEWAKWFVEERKRFGLPD